MSEFDKKISALTSGGDSQAADEYVIARGGSNYKITGANIAAAATKLGTITTGVWQGTAIANTYIATGLDVTKLTAGATLPSNVLASSLTSVGTLTSLTVSGNTIVGAEVFRGSDTSYMRLAGGNPASTGANLLLFGSTHASAPGRVSINASGAGNIELQANTTGVILFRTAGANERMRLDASGNLGLGVTPQTGWSSNRTTFQVHGTVQPNILFTGNPTNGGAIWTNGYYDGTNNKYIANGAASLFSTGNGGFQWFNAPSGTAGNTFTLTQAMTLNASGELIVGNGDAVASPAAGVFRGTDGSGTNIAGAALTIQGGRGTGSGAGGAVIFSTSAAGASGTTLRSASERMRVTTGGEVLIGTTTTLGNAPGWLTVSRTNTNPIINIFRDDTSIGNGDNFGGMAFWGNDTTSNTPTIHAYIRAVASGTHAAGDNPTDVVIETTPDGTETSAEAGRITQAGSYVLKGGTTTAAAGVGIIFPATQVASANANSLDDYEEGTWTPTFSATGATFSYSYQIGRYTKIGRLVTVHGRITLSGAAPTGGSGTVNIAGLPFTVAGPISSAEWGNSGVVSRAENFASNTPLALKCNVSATTASMMYRTTVGGATAELQWASMAADITILFTASYEVD